MNAPLAIDDALLRGWALPDPGGDADKEERGRVLVVAGSREMPGAAVLAGTAALRAGAGKLMVATPASAAPAVALALTEARVIALPEAADGGPLLSGIAALQPFAAATRSVLVGPGMIDRGATIEFALALLSEFTRSVVILDALAMECVQAAARFVQPVIVTPHAGELAGLTGRSKEELLAAPLEAALRQAAAWRAIVTAKGATTCVASPDGRAWLHQADTPGLATSGSGDVLAGIMAGLVARGAAPEQAAVWAVALHARAGQRLAARMGRLGMMARELAAEVPLLMDGLGGRG